MQNTSAEFMQKSNFVAFDVSFDIRLTCSDCFNLKGFFNFNAPH